jgi:hypothetical protein
VCVCLYEFAFVYLVFDTFPLAEGHHLARERALVLADLSEGHLLCAVVITPHHATPRHTTIHTTIQPTNPLSINKLRR